MTIVTDNAKIYIPMGDLVDFEAERKRLEKELAQAQDKLDFINKSFQIRASLIKHLKRWLTKIKKML